MKPVEGVSTMEITEVAVSKCLINLWVNKSQGPDMFRPMVLKSTAVAWVYPLTKLFNQSIITGSLLNDWKKANVSPIHKKGSRSDAGNYRPVSLTSVPCKMLESLMRDRIVNHLEVNNLFSEHHQIGRASCRERV